MAMYVWSSTPPVTAGNPCEYNEPTTSWVYSVGPTLAEIKAIVKEAIREVLDEKRRENITPQDALRIIADAIEEEEK